MSDWTPKVGDRVMVGKHGPYRVSWVNRHGTACDLRDDEGRNVGVSILASVLTPAPEPEPEEPTAPGALVRDGDGNLFARGDASRWVDLRCKFDDNSNWHWGHAWQSLSPRPITVILADPAEVETLRDREAMLEEQVDEYQRDYESAAAERDELKRRVGDACSLALAGPVRRTYESEVMWRQRIATVLRGEQ